MSEAEIIHDAEVVGTEIVPATHGTLFQTEDPLEVIQRATRIAAPLAELVRKQKLTSNISGKEHVRVEGWTLLGSMLGVFPVTVWSRRLEHEEGWEARVEARTLSGAVVGAAEAECTRSEKMWSHDPGLNKWGKPIEPRDEYALRSMAQTRATSKALRQPLGFVMQLAGFDPTPAEEMPRDGGVSAPPDKQASDGIRVPTTWPKLTECISLWDETVHDLFVAFGQSAARALFGPSVDTKKLASSDKKFLLQKCAGAWLHVREEFDPNTLPYPGLEDIRAAFARVMDGLELAIPDEELDAEAADAAGREA